MFEMSSKIFEILYFWSNSGLFRIFSIIFCLKSQSEALNLFFASVKLKSLRFCVRFPILLNAFKPVFIFCESFSLENTLTFSMKLIVWYLARFETISRKFFIAGFDATFSILSLNLFSCFSRNSIISEFILSGSFSPWLGSSPPWEGSSPGSVEFCSGFEEASEHIEEYFLLEESLKYKMKYEFSICCSEKEHWALNSVLPTSCAQPRLFSPPRISIFISDCSSDTCKIRNNSKNFRSVFIFYMLK